MNEVKCFTYTGLEEDENASDAFYKELGELYATLFNSKPVFIEATNINWLHDSGHKVVKHSEDEENNSIRLGQTLVHELYPTISSFDFEAMLYKVDDDKMKLVLFHHDCPTGTTLLYREATKKESRELRD